MDKNKVKAAIIGCGGISKSHAKAIIKSSDIIDFHAVCDIEEEKAISHSKEYNVKNHYTDYKKMLEDVPLDMVCMCTPSGMHANLSIGCAKAGVNVLCEKPLDVTAEKLDMMIDAFKSNNVLLGSIFQYRTYPGVIKAKQMIESGELGRILIANGYCKVYRSDEYYKRAGWRGTWELDGGGCLMNQGVHAIDLLNCLSGGVSSLRANISTLARDIEVEDTAFISFKFKNGAYGSFEGTTLFLPGEGVKVEIQCEKGRIVFDGVNTYLYKQGSEPVNLDKEQKEKFNTANDPLSLSSSGHEFLIRDFALAVLNGKKPFIPGETGRKAVDIILKIYESSKTGKELEV